MRIFAITASLIGLLVAACAERAAYGPTENVTALSPTGEPAAAYHISTQPGQAAQVAVSATWDGGRPQRAHQQLASARLAILGLRLTGPGARCQPTTELVGSRWASDPVGSCYRNPE